MDYKLSFKERKDNIVISLYYNLGIYKNIDFIDKLSKLLNNSSIFKEVGVYIGCMSTFEPFALDRRGGASMNNLIKFFLPGSSDFNRRTNTYTYIILKADDNHIIKDGIQITRREFKVALEEFEFFLKYLFHEIKLDLKLFSHKDFFKFRNNIIEEENLRAKITFNENRIVFHHFRYNSYDRGIIYDNIKKELKDVSFLKYINQYLNINKKISFEVTIEDAITYKDVIINAIRKFEYGRKLEEYEL